MPLQKSRSLFGLALMLLLVIYVPSSSAGERLGSAQERRGAVVVKITDGDTVWVSVNSRRVKLRLLGIDTPEKYRGRKLRRDAARCGISEAAMVCLGKGGPAGPFLKEGVRQSLKERICLLCAGKMKRRQNGIFLHGQRIWPKRVFEDQCGIPV